MNVKWLSVGAISVTVAAFATIGKGQVLPPPPEPTAEQKRVVEPLPLPAPAPPDAYERQPPPPQPSSRVTPGERDHGAVEYRLRGPVHEGYAMPVTPDVHEPLRVDEPPPEPLDEQPPSAAPVREDDAAVWIPGYWGWDEGQGYVWVSGVWRHPPPEMRWTPGYWAQTEAGVQWVPGCWTRDSDDRLAYLPEPPPPHAENPGEPSAEDQFWVPGVWVYEEQNYRWREGFWTQSRKDWVWVPAGYVWTPRGYLFVDGYWDYPPADRGILFAPAAPAPGWHGPYVPGVVVDFEAVLANLFVQSSYYHYCFGDYYDAPGRTRFWASSVADGGSYDPLWWFYRTYQVDVLQQVIRQHQLIAQQRNLRPPLTWGHYQQWLRGQSGQSAGPAPLAYGFDSYVGRKGKKFVKLSGADVEQWLDVRRDSQQFLLQRAAFESNGAWVARGGEAFFNLPPGHGGVPPGQWKKLGGVSIPPGQLKKFGPAVPGPYGGGPAEFKEFKGKGHGGGKGHGKGGGKGKGK